MAQVIMQCKRMGLNISIWVMFGLRILSKWLKTKLKVIKSSSHLLTGCLLNVVTGEVFILCSSNICRHTQMNWQRFSIFLKISEVINRDILPLK